MRQTGPGPKAGRSTWASSSLLSLLRAELWLGGRLRNRWRPGRPPGRGARPCTSRDQLGNDVSGGLGVGAGGGRESRPRQGRAPRDAHVELRLGPLVTTQSVVALRAGNLSWSFRDVDLDRVNMNADDCAGTLLLDAASPHLIAGRPPAQQLRIAFRAPPLSFSAPLYIPTEDGFSNQPGSVECRVVRGVGRGASICPRRPCAAARGAARRARVWRAVEVWQYHAKLVRGSSCGDVSAENSTP